MIISQYFGTSVKMLLITRYYPITRKQSPHPRSAPLIIQHKRRYIAPVDSLKMIYLTCNVSFIPEFSNWTPYHCINALVTTCFQIHVYTQNSSVVKKRRKIKVCNNHSSPFITAIFLQKTLHDLPYDFGS